MLKEQVVEKCGGCRRVLTDNTCEAYIKPSVKWRLGNCNLASHIVIEETKKVGYKPGKFGKKKSRR